MARLKNAVGAAHGVKGLSAAEGQGTSIAAQGGEAQGQVFKSLADHSQEFIGMCDLEFRPFYVNEAGLKLVGLDSLEDACGVRVQDFFFPEDQQYLREEFLPKVAREGRGEIEIRFRHFKTGAALWMICNLFQVRDAQGRVSGYATVGRDITERKQGEEAVREKEAELREAQRLAQIGNWHVDLQSGVETVSDELQRIFGFDPATEGMPRFSEQGGTCYPMGEWERIKDAGRRALETGVGWELEVRAIRKGAEIWVRSRGEVVRDVGGRITGLRGTVQDISERKRVEEALRFLVEYGDSRSGEHFFRALAQYLAENLRADFICIDRLEEGSLRAQTLAMFCDGSFQDNVSYGLRDTPCGDVVGKAVCCFPKNVRGLFPNDAVLQELRAEGYLGTTLWSSQGKPIGLIAMIWRQPLADSQVASSILQVVGVRAAGELERCQAEEALRESEERLRLAHKASNDVVWDWDIVQDRQRWNEAGAVVFGWTESVEHAVSAAWWAERVHPEDRHRVEEGFFAVVKEPEAKYWHEEYRFRKADGSYAEVIDRGYVLRDKAGKAVRMIGAMLDITERKRAEEAVREAQARTERILSSITDAFFAVDRQWRFTYVNGQAERLLRRPAKELLGANVWELFRGAEAFRRRYEQAVASGQATEFEEFYAPLATWFEVHAYPSADGLSVFFRDVTERKLAEEGLARLAAIVEWSEDAIVSKTLDGTIQTWNAGAERMFGYRAEEVIGRPATVLMPPERLGEEKRVQAQLRRGEPVEHYETVRLTKDGQRLDVSLTISPIKDSGGRIIGASKIARDIGDLVRAREVVARDKRELERLVGERTAKLHELVGELEHFSYTITHDMKAPLRAMRGYVEIASMMWEGGEVEKAKEFLGKISTSAARMDALIADALNYSRSVRQELPLEDVDAGALLRGMLDSYPELQPERARIEVEGRLPVVLANEAGLTQVFSNLLGNAVKFVKPGEKPDIRVWASQREGWVRIWVEDKGIGIRKEMLPRVFDMFARGSKSYEGTGIGLALVRKVGQRMGGRVGLESEEGKGSRFWIELRCGEAKESGGQVRLSPGAAEESGTVLYVEDEEGDALFMERAFKGKGLEGKLRLVGDGRAAIDYLSGAGQYGDREKYPVPALVLLDLNLPHVPGFGVLEWMRNHPDYARTPVVIFSSSTREDDRVKAKELGANEFVSKPSSGMEFGGVVEGLRGKWMRQG